ncbi:hypothetical protein PO878_10475 [Iamia majanohamensis]|uniref:Uncharacterized protein n=1 Tax=Iamia majanohamensis TaxID=467976 RepID=A0AAE9Y9N2_9ACTN|nr:hypothetical protein [Iamia majanohamensis]WCO69147.1 hypothetical protein PO878_10475 [Iamia majanohamensis]
MSAEPRRGWAKGWDLGGATVGLVLVGAGLALLAGDEALDALPRLAIVGVVACALLAFAVAQLDARAGDALSRLRTRLRMGRRGLT